MSTLLDTFVAVSKVITVNTLTAQLAITAESFGVCYTWNEMNCVICNS